MTSTYSSASIDVVEIHVVKIHRVVVVEIHKISELEKAKKMLSTSQRFERLQSNIQASKKG